MFPTALKGLDVGLTSAPFLSAINLHELPTATRHGSEVIEDLTMSHPSIHAQILNGKL